MAQCLKPIQVTLDGISSLYTTQLGVTYADIGISLSAEGALNPTVHVTN